VREEALAELLGVVRAHKVLGDIVGPELGGREDTSTGMVSSCGPGNIVIP
jgi:hypothetical protein